MLRRSGLRALAFQLVCRAPALTAMSERQKVRVLDSHIHLWTPETSDFPRAPGAPSIPSHLETPGKAAEMHRAMTEAGIEGALIVQPVNYGQDYSYMLHADDLFPGFFKGMCVADPTAQDPVAALRARVSRPRGFWVGVRFNPYKWPQGTDMSDDVGRSLFAAAGELGLPVGFMPFKGLVEHIEAIEALLKHSPSTQVIIDHWGFILQPATGFGADRKIIEESWTNLLRIGRDYPQVHVKLSGMFRNSPQEFPFLDLEPRFKELLKVFSAERLMWGSDAPFFLDFGDYSDAPIALEKWPTWGELDDEQRGNILHGTAEKLFKPWGKPSTSPVKEL